MVSMGGVHLCDETLPRSEAVRPRTCDSAQSWVDEFMRVFVTVRWRAYVCLQVRESIGECAKERTNVYDFRLHVHRALLYARELVTCMSERAALAVW